MDIFTLKKIIKHIPKLFLLEREIQIESVKQLSIQENRTVGVITATQKYHSRYTMVCADGLSRYLLNKIGVTVDVYFTHIQLIVTPHIDIKL
jgi:glycine/D-amino acid oxidase-like deaminating enzyme